MNAIQLQRNLKRATIFVTKIRRNPNDTIFDLNCGAQVTVYHSTGVVVVRGKIKSYYQWDAIAALEQVLPYITRWNHTFE